MTSTFTIVLCVLRLVADVVGAGERVAVAAGGERVGVVAGEDRDRVGAGEAAAGVVDQRRGCAGDRLRGDAGAAVGVVDLRECDRAVGVVGAAAVRRDRAAARRRRVGGECERGVVRAAGVVLRGHRLGAVRLGRRVERVGLRRARAARDEAGEGGEGVACDAALAVGRAGGDVERAGAGGAVERRRADRVDAGARLGEREARRGRIGEVDLDDRRARDAVADVVGAGQRVAVAAGGQPVLRRGADDRRGCAVARAGIAGERAVLARQGRGRDPGERVGVVGAGADREAAVVVVALRADEAGGDAVDDERAAGRVGRVGR